MPNWCSSTCCGRISAPSISPRRWPNTRGASGALAPALADAPDRIGAGRILRHPARSLRRPAGAAAALIRRHCLWRSGVCAAALVLDAVICAPRAGWSAHGRCDAVAAGRGADRTVAAVAACAAAAVVAVPLGHSPSASLRGAVRWSGCAATRSRSRQCAVPAADRLGQRYRRLLVGRAVGGPRLAPASRRARPGRARSAACSPPLRSASLAAHVLQTPRPWRRRADRRRCSASLRRPAICWKAS